MQFLLFQSFVFSLNLLKKLENLYLLCKLAQERDVLYDTFRTHSLPIVYQFPLDISLQIS